ncbi:DUF1127 domain-containing protein [Ciceribacter sp. L1K22]|uniref:DUF1127 domain-containing protein n=1 Tax=Ciceribacter sp. L1K22 TaxID=2820275 RepID=UPI001ABE23DE|nr:DUF1127 domain-containing protein [Ciceribacter sp. L1K22]MBO3760644.1 DUF1127 domain-containing protein [Ciceribacter sp. L1K22]
MFRDQLLIEASPRIPLQELREKFGFWRIALSLLINEMRLRRRYNAIAGLSDRMRRDMGLPLEERFPPPSRPSLWDIRF